MEANDTILPIEERVKFGVWHGRERLAEAQAVRTYLMVLLAIADYIEAFHGLYYIKNLDVAKFCDALRQGKLPEIGGKG